MFPTYKFISEQKGHFVPYNVKEDNTWYQDQYLIGSAYYGKMQQIEDAINRGATQYKEAAIQAARGGKLKVLQYLIEKYPQDLDYASIAEATLEYDHIEIFKWLYDNYYEPNMKILFNKAAIKGALNILEFGFSNFIEDANNILTLSAESGNTACLMLALRYGATDYNTAAYAAAYNGHIRSFQYLFEIGITNISECMDVAIETEKWDFIREVLAKDVIDVKMTIQAIVQHHCKDLDTTHRLLEHLLTFI